MARLVIDTNVLIQALPSRSRYHDLWISLLDGRNSFCITTSILEEYQEILTLKANQHIASLVISRIINNPHTVFVDPYFSFNLIQVDSDDNKFVDCAIAGNAKYIVSEDKHFDVLKEIPFPKVDIISLDEIMKEL